MMRAVGGEGKAGQVWWGDSTVQADAGKGERRGTGEDRWMVVTGRAQAAQVTGLGSGPRVRAALTL